MKYNYTDDDVEAARRGLGMMKLSNDELVRLVTRHSQIDAFASKVIAAAANRLLVIRGRDGSDAR